MARLKAVDTTCMYVGLRVHVRLWPRGYMYGTYAVMISSTAVSIGELACAARVCLAYGTCVSKAGQHSPVQKQEGVDRVLRRNRPPFLAHVESGDSPEVGHVDLKSAKRRMLFKKRYMCKL